MHRFIPQRLYFPAMAIVATVLILLGITIFSTIRNMNMAEKRELDDLRRQAFMLIRALEAGTKTHMAMPMWRMDELGRLFHETAQDQSIAAVYLIDSENRILHHSNPDREGLPAEWNPAPLPDIDIPYELHRDTTGRLLLYMAKRFAPTAAGSGKKMRHNDSRHNHADATLVVALSVSEYEQARKADFRHAIFMGILMVVLGAGAIFFLYVIQNYYLVGRALKQSRDDTREVIRHMADGLVSVDNRGCLLFLNPQALYFLNLSPPPPAGADMSRHLPFDDTGVTAALSNGETTLNREITLTSIENRRISLSFSVTPLREEEGAIRGAVILIRDLTAIRALEMQMRRSETLAAMGELAASVAHEIRNPLSSIKTGIRFLTRRMASGDPEVEYGELIASEVDRINRVVSDLLSFSRPNEPVKKQEDLLAICRHVIQLVGPEAQAKNASITLSPDSGDHFADVDRHQLIQVFMNLLLNALAATDDGGAISIHVDDNQEKGCVIIAVSDSGPGLPKAADKIFDPFFTTREKGTGLGLAIAKKIIDGHGGDITAESPAGRLRGARFTVCLPITALPTTPGDN